MSIERERIADELLRGCPAESHADHEAIAAAIRNGRSLAEILRMPEADRWPETYVWLKAELSE